jgi:hypothetical protein
MNENLLCYHAGVPVYQDPVTLRVWYTADLDVDVDGARHAYRLDNRQPPALDDVHASAGWPNGEWWDVLVPDPDNPRRPFVDDEGFCVSMTSYQRFEFARHDRRRYVDAESVPYSVCPGKVRKLAKGVMLGCKARITRRNDDLAVDTVYADSSGGNIGEAGWAAARRFDPTLSASCGDDRKIYLFEFWPGVPAVVNGEQFKLIPYS